MFTPENGDVSQPNGARTGEPDSTSTERGVLVPAVVKAFRIIEALGRSDEALGTSELSRRLNLGKSTVHGLLTTLESLGVLEAVNGTKRYRIERGFSALTRRGGSQRDLREIARPCLERLASATEETAFLGVPSDTHVTILDMVHGRPTLSVSAPIGSSIPLLAGAVGKVIVSTWELEQRESFLAKPQLTAFTQRSIVDAVAYRRAVEETLERGAALDLDEYVDGMRAAAAPIFGPPHRLVGVIWVAGFSRHIDRSRLPALATQVANEAAEITRRLDLFPQPAETTEASTQYRSKLSV